MQPVTKKQTSTLAGPSASRYLASIALFPGGYRCLGLDGKTDSKILPIENKDLETDILHFQSVVIQFLEKTNEKALAFSPERISVELKELEDQYQKIKSTILEYGAQGKIVPASMLLHLDLLSDMRRLVEQMGIGYRYLASIRDRLESKKLQTKD